MIKLITTILGLASTTVPLVIDSVNAIKKGDGDLAARRAREAAERELDLAIARERLKKHEKK